MSLEMHRRRPIDPLPLVVGQSPSRRTRATTSFPWYRNCRHDHQSNHQMHDRESLPIRQTLDWSVQSPDDDPNAIFQQSMSHRIGVSQRMTMTTRMTMTMTSTQPRSFHWGAIHRRNQDGIHQDTLLFGQDTSPSRVPRDLPNTNVLLNSNCSI